MDPKTAARILWDDSKMNHELAEANCAICVVSNDVWLVDHAVKLYDLQFTNKIIFTGAGAQNYNAHSFAATANKLGVDSDNILIENDSYNLGEHFEKSKALLSSRHVHTDRIIVITKSDIEKRTFAACKKYFNTSNIIISSPSVDFEYFYNSPTKNEFIKNLVVNFNKNKLYPKLGYQIEVNSSEAADAAFEYLVSLGYCVD